MTSSHSPVSNSVLRRIILIAGAVFVAEGALYSAITPLVGEYAHTGRISTTEAGLLSATYAIGLIPGCLIAAWLSSRGTRIVTLAGTAGFATTTLIFGFVDGIAALCLVRAAQGLAAGCMWAGALALLMSASPRERRGEYFGTALGVGILGTVIGPAIGLVAVTVGKGPAYLVATAAIAALVMPLVRISAPAPPARDTPVELRALAGNPLLWLGAWLTFLASAALGAIITLLPFRLEEAGAGPVGIGIAFLIASAVAAVTARQLGQLTDSRGAVALSRVGLLAGIGMFVLLMFPLALAGLVATTVAAMGAAFTGIGIPAGRLVFDSAETRGVSPGVSAPIFLLSLALGESIGGPAGAGLAVAHGDAAPFAFLALLAALSLAIEGRFFREARQVSASSQAFD